VIAANLPGIKIADFEKTFPDGPYGSMNSIRTDLILKNAAGEIIAIYDVKTGGAKLSANRTSELLKKTGAAPGTPVIELSVRNGAIRRADQDRLRLAQVRLVAQRA
jgi:hypothetical protein